MNSLMCNEMWTFITALTPCKFEHTLLSALCFAIAWKEQQQRWKSVLIMLSNTFLPILSIKTRVDMSKASHLVYTSHPKSLTNPLLAYNLTKPLT